jgi:C-terminal processing protease CtpA/Prc
LERSVARFRVEHICRVLLAIYLTWPAAGRAAPPGNVTPAFHTLSLAALGKIWGMVRYRHPFLLDSERALDWDRALVEAIPIAARARNDDEAVAAMAVMLRHLGDPLTRVIASEAAPTVKLPPAGPLFSARRGKTLLVDLTRPLGQAEWPERIEEIRAAMENARAVILDLRVGEASSGFLLGLHLPRLIPDFLSRDVLLPSERSIVHFGYRAAAGTGPIGESAFVTIPAEQLRARPLDRRRPVALIVNANSGVPRLALALQASGDAIVIAQGTDLEEQLATNTLPITGTHNAIVLRVRELESADRRKIAADLTLPADAPFEQALTAATDWVNGSRALTARRRGAPSRNQTFTPARWQPERAYVEMRPPRSEYRLLALFRLSSVVQWFFPHRNLMDKPWEQVVDEFIPRFEGAVTEQAYELTMAELVAHLGDGHAAVTGGDELARFFGGAVPPFSARMVEGQPLVTGLRDHESADAARVRLGDVLLSIEGVPVAERMRQIEKYIPSSNETWRRFRVLNRALEGAEGSIARLRVKHGDGKEEVLSVPRRGEWWRRAERSGPVVKVMDGNVGYVDLDRLEPDAVEGAFQTLRNTRGIVFDMRGYPRMTGWSVAARINVKRATVAAILYCPVVRGAEGGPADRLTFDATIPPADGRLYTGKTAMLIDERTMSQAEHTGLLLEAAGGTKFVGSPTAGANGDTTSLAVPGGLTVSFTGQEVRHADGRQLQRVGLRPDIEARPTLAGIRSGRDEVLERAVELLRR